ncbi:MAG: helix-turn-helix domain-containing protein [Bacteroidota bacterium]
MRKNIPKIAFEPTNQDHSGFEIVTIDKIARDKGKYLHDPEEPHQLQFYNTIFYTGGQGRQFIDFQWFPVKENSLVYLTRDQVNAFDFSGSLKGICLIFTESYFLDCFSNLPEDFVFRLFNPQLFSPVVQIPKGSEFREYFDLLLKEYPNSNAFNQRTVLQSLFTILISKAEQIKQHQTFHIKDSKKMRLFRQFAGLLEEHHSKSRNADYYARELAITYKHLNATCRALLNKTAKQVIDEYVILQAKRSLTNSDLKSNELAYSLGFEDPTNFTKYFKKHTGLTPNSFKKSLKIA